MSSPRTGAGRHPARRRRSLGTMLLLGMLVPLVGLGGVAGAEIRQRWTSRTTSATLERGASHLVLLADFVGALAMEEAFSNIVALASDLAEPEVRLDATRARLAGARALVDSERFSAFRSAVDRDGQLGDMRRRLDAGEAGYTVVSEEFTAVDDTLESGWRESMGAVEAIADRDPLDAEMRSHLRTLRESMRAFGYADDRIQHGLALLLDGPSDGALRALLDADSRFEAARESALLTAGPGTAARWQRFGTDPAAERTEATLSLAAEIGFGAVPPPASIAPSRWVQGLEDGATWAILLTDVVRVAASDLQAVAAAQSARDSRAVVVQVAAVALLAALSIVAATVIARRVARPARDLEAAARQVEAGGFELRPLPASGPRELAATVRAFNDMAATLAAVEDHAVALAEDPTAPLLDHPLPGRTGEALQTAIDRLRASIGQAEAQRVELHELATRDGLTGLLNRAAAYAAIERELARARREGQSLLAVYVDLDGLKSLNDTHGHQAGDQAIVRTAEALRATTRSADVVARLGGDEFMVVGAVPPGGSVAVHAFAERIHAAVGERRVTTDAGPVGLRCSVGVALSDPASDTTEGLVRAADAAMYRAKAAGRDRIDVHEPPETMPQLV